MRVIGGLVTGIAIGCVVAVAASLLLSPDGPDARAASGTPGGADPAEPAPAAREVPRSSGLPQLTSDTEPARPREPSE